MLERPAEQVKNGRVGSSDKEFGGNGSVDVGTVIEQHRLGHDHAFGFVELKRVLEQGDGCGDSHYRSYSHAHYQQSENSGDGSPQKGLVAVHMELFYAGNRGYAYAKQSGIGSATYEYWHV